MKSYLRKPIFLSVTMASLLLAMCLGCAGTQVNKATGQPLTAAEKASIIADELTKHYKFLHTQVLEFTKTANEEQVRWLVWNVNPHMNQAKAMIKAYNEAVILWREGGVMPQDMYEREKMIRG